VPPASWSPGRCQVSYGPSFSPAGRATGRAFLLGRRGWRGWLAGWSGYLRLGHRLGAGLRMEFPNCGMHVRRKLHLEQRHRAQLSRRRWGGQNQTIWSWRRNRPRLHLAERLHLKCGRSLRRCWKGRRLRWRRLKRIREAEGNPVGDGRLLWLRSRTLGERSSGNSQRKQKNP